MPRATRLHWISDAKSSAVHALCLCTPYCHRVPRSQRGGEVVEPLVSEQWFVRMAPLAEPALAAVADGSIKIVPERFEKIYNGWLENIKVRAL